MGFLTKTAGVAKKKRITESMEAAFNKAVFDLNERESHKNSGSFHVSSLGSCLRKVYYQHTNPEKFPINVLRKFWAGKDFGQRIVKAFQFSGNLWGSAVCPECAAWYGNQVIKTCMHAKCKGMQLNYSELGIRNLTNRLSGKVDLFYKEDKKIYLVEAKSATTYYKTHDRESVKRFVPAHIHQGNMYVGMIRAKKRAAAKGHGNKVIFFDSVTGEVMNDLPDSVDLGCFVLFYEDKNSNDIKAHKFAYDHEMYKADVASVKLFYQYLADEEAPPKDEGKACKYCDFVGLCNGKA